ncbi:MAG: ISNCY family transposase [Acidobacteria bacterium]|nr:ISNCY family transposase [Acidobacteriota bacterium]
MIKTFPDCRERNNISKTLSDAALGGFAVLFTQNSSFLSYQKTMQKTQGKNNATSLFGIKEILSDNHIRNLLDEVPPANVFPMFSYILDELNQRGYLDQFRSYNNNLLVALDATQYFSSNKIHCDSCSQAHHKEGVITYSHSVITPVIVKPDSEKVISLIPEFITPQDGHQKQDCENAASKRWLETYGSMLKKLKVIILGDDLYCHQSICEKILSEGLNFILVCKEDSHKTLYEYVQFLKEDVQTLEVRRWQGKEVLLDRYRFLNGVPLRGGEDALEVNWCELITTNEGSGASGASGDSGDNGDSGDSGKIIYKNTFVSNIKISQENVKEIVANGRARWKIENENNNTLKTKGYHLEHNFGHGKKNLSMLLLTFNLLAFLFHTVLDMVDERYELIRQTLPTRKIFFQDVRSLTRYIYFSNWDALMKFMIKGLMLEFPKVVVDTT